jgi:hypothetical protein
MGGKQKKSAPDMPTYLQNKKSVMNQLANYPTPQWMAIAFLLVFPYAVFSVAFLARKHAPTAQENKVFYTILGFYALYLIYVSVGSFNGLFDRESFPPMILLYSTVPLAFFLFLVVIKMPIFQQILEKATLPDLVRVHFFRLIGVFFVLLAFHDALPKPFALLAGLGDMTTAITSIFVAKAIENKKPYARKLTYAWNTFGLVDIILTAVLANVLTKISIDTGAMGVDSLAKFPFCWIPAFAPPTIIFLHVMVYRKLKTWF